MRAIRPIRNENDYEGALARLEDIFQAEIGTDDGDERDILFDLIEVYERKHHAIPPPDAIAAIEFYMEQRTLTRRDLAPHIGGRAKVSEVLSGKRPITMSMARALHRHLGIAADVLLQEPGARFLDTPPTLDYARFPLKAMAKAGWIPNANPLKDNAEELVSALMERAGGREFAAAPLYRKNDGRRINAKTDHYALTAWTWQVIAQARELTQSTHSQPKDIGPDLLGEVARLSQLDDGPARARELLASCGVGLEFARHLPRTHLDGAALRLPDGVPAIGLTLRYDRIDNFWFTLLHELAHLTRHMRGADGAAGFVDDHTLRGVESAGDEIELEADQLAQDALIPPEIWGDGDILNDPRPLPVIALAWRARVHPAVVAGRIRHELGNYRLLTQFVGAGEVRRHFEGA